MALVKGTNALGTVAEADTYFADRMDVSEWHDADVGRKGRALVTATRVLEGQPWAGYAKEETQALAFPRVLSYFDPRLGRVVSLDGTETPSRVVDASFELAFHLLVNEDLLNESDTVDSLSVGPIHLRDIRRPSLIPGVVKRLIQPLLVNGGISTWWRAN